MPTSVRILTYNIWVGGENRQSKITEVIRQAKPDIVALQEVNDEEFFYKLAGDLAMQPLLAHTQFGYNVGLLSALPVADWEPYSDPGVFRVGAVRAQINSPAGPLNICGLHLQARYGSKFEEKRTSEAKAVVEIMAPFINENSLLLGDFNTLSPQDILKPEDWPGGFLRQVEKMPRSALQVILEAGYTDCYRSLYAAEKYRNGYTLPALQPNVRLDYLFASPDLHKNLKLCEVVTHEDAANASDHLPVLAEFEFE